MPIRYLNSEEIIQIHEDVLKESVGYSGMINYSNLDFVVSKARTQKTVERAAAIIFHGIVTSHPFVDGNKRTAVISTETFLKENGKEFLATNKDIWGTVRKASEGMLKFEEVVTWIKENIK